MRFDFVPFFNPGENIPLTIMPSLKWITLVLLKESLVKIQKFSKKLATGYSKYISNLRLN